MFVWTCRMHFWQTSWKIFAKKPTVFCTMPEIGNKIFSFRENYLFSKCSSGQIDCSFENPAKKSSPKNQKKLLNVRKSWKNIIFSLRKYFSSKSSSGQLECSFDNPVEFFSVFLKSWAFWKKTWIFFKVGWGAKFAVECVSNDFISWKCLFHFICEILQKIRNFLFGKIKKFDEETIFLKKNASILLKGIFNKIGGRKICQY